MHRSKAFGAMVTLCCSLMLMVGCGWGEADAIPADGHSGADRVDRGSDDQHDETDVSDEETSAREVIEHPFEVPFDAQAPDDDSELEEESEDLCTMTCLRATFCPDHEIDDEELVQCIDSCEFALDENFVDESDIECVAEADDCSQAGDCYGEFQACDDVCQWHDNCDGHDDRDECTRWCGAEIWSGELRWDAYGCLIDTVEEACPAFGLCGVSEPGE